MRNRNKLCFHVLNNIKVYHLFIICLFSICLFSIYLFLTSLTGNTINIYCIQCKIHGSIYIENTQQISHNNAVVLHDDVILSPTFFKDVLKLIDSAPADWEYLQLSVASKLIQRHNEHVVDPWIAWMPEHMSASAYVINKKGLTKLRNSQSLKKYTSTDVIVKTQWEVEFRMKKDIHSIKQSILMLSTTLIQTVDDIERERNFWRIDKGYVDIYKLVVVVKEQRMYEKVTSLIWNDHVQFVINPEPYNKFYYLQQFIPIMGSYKYVIIKDSDQRMPPIQTMLNPTAVIKGPLRQKLYGGIDERQWFKFQDGYLWKNTHNDEFNSMLYYENIISKEVPFLEQFFVIFDGDFAKWFFNQILTDDMLLLDGKPITSDWGPDVIWCKAAKQWNPSKTSCVIVPVVSQHDDTQQVIVWNSSEKRTKVNENQLAQYTSKFPKWVFYSKNI